PRAADSAVRVPLVLAPTKRRGPRGWQEWPHAFYVALRIAAIVNTRLQEAFPTTIKKNAEDLFDSSVKGELEQPDVLTALIGSALALGVFELSAHVPDRRR